MTLLEVALQMSAENIKPRNMVRFAFWNVENLATAPTAFDGRSDYGPFIDRGIPAAGCLPAPRTSRQRPKPLGMSLAACQEWRTNPCYHLACDTVGNINPFLLEEMADAVAHAVLTVAQTTSAVNGTGKGSSDTIDFLRQGSHYIK